MNSVNIDKAALDRAINEALELTADWLKSDVTLRQVVPKETGNLEGSITGSNSGTVSRDGEYEFSLNYTTPYAEKLYFHPEYNFRSDKNSNARGEWLKDYKSGKKSEELKAAFARFLKERIEG